METILVKDIYSVDTISKGNAKAWVKLMEYMKTKTGNVKFDFKGIEVVQPWATPEFKLFMQDERVHLKLWCNENTANSINIMCKLNGFSGERTENEEIVPAKTLSKEELQIIKMSSELQSYFDIEDGQPVLNIYKRFDQVGVPVTVSYIEGAMKKYAEEHSCDSMKLETRGITVQSSVIENITGLIQKMADVGVNLTINSNDPEVMNKVGMYQSLSNKSIFDDKDKLRLIKANLQIGKVGMLIKYKESKATDEFGRSGKGKTVSSRVAVYMGLKKNKEGLICVCFRSYIGNTFYTHIHWSLEHDNDVLEELEYRDEIIPISSFGMYNDFLGSRFHFIAPVQIRPEDTVTMYGLDEFGKVTYTKYTIPERIKAVLDDWKISYDAESMILYIQKTKELLG